MDIAILALFRSEIFTSVVGCLTSGNERVGLIYRISKRRCWSFGTTNLFMLRVPKGGNLSDLSGHVDCNFGDSFDLRHRHRRSRPVRCNVMFERVFLLELVSGYQSQCCTCAWEPVITRSNLSDRVSSVVG